MQADLTKLPEFMNQLLVIGQWSVVTAFAVLHHIPSTTLRLEILNTDSWTIAAGRKADPLQLAVLKQ